MSATVRLAVPILRALRPRRSIALCYHGVGERSSETDPGFLRVTPARFGTQVESLLAAGFEFVTVAELAERANGGEPPPGLVALSFDDGMEDNHAVLLPLLRRYGIPATVYVVSGLIGQPNPWMGAGSGARMMTEHELRELADAGVELGAHTVTHPDLSTLPRAECLAEMLASKERLEALTGASVRTFAYPFCRFSDEAVQAAREAGFSAAVTCWGRGSWEPFELQRSTVTGKDELPSLVLKVAGVYERLFASGAGRLVRGSTRPLRAWARAGRERLARPPRW